VKSLKDFKLNENIYTKRKELENNSEKFSLKYLLAILNSKFGYYSLNQVRRSQIGFYPDDFKKLQVKKISFPLQKPFINLVEQILSAKRINTNSDTSALEAEIDRMVYELYGLT